MTQNDPTAPIRKSSLPCTPPPEWEFYTWFPHPDGGGDMVPGQRQRGVLVRRRVSFGDWEPVRPDHWADELPTDVAAVVSPPADRAAAPHGANESTVCHDSATAAGQNLRFPAVLPTPDQQAAVERVRALADEIDTEMRTEPDTQRSAMQMEAVTRIRAALDGHPLRRLAGEAQQDGARP
ncbi:hypothetical protein ACH5A3_21205 [Streptomyces echinatus]|uniref:hypothetical protein n=1 Tax=Streptomyces echinatus TaxID=67293 RepID=UPI003790EE6A